MKKCSKCLKKCNILHKAVVKLGSKKVNLELCTDCYNGHKRSSL